MPKIPTYTAQVEPQSGGMPQATAAQFGGGAGLAAAGGALNELIQGGMQIAQRQYSKQEQLKRLQTNLEWTQYQTDVDKFYAKSKEEADEAATDFTKKIETAVTTGTSKFFADRPNLDEESRLQLQAQALRYKSAVVAQASAFEASRRGEKVRRDLGFSLDNMAQSVLSNPDRLDDALLDATNLINSAPIDDAQKADFLRKNDGALVVSAVSGMIAQGKLDRAESMLTDKRLTAREQVQLGNQIEAERKHRAAMARANEAVVASQIGMVDNAIMRGEVLNPQLVETLRQKAKATGNPQLVAALANVEEAGQEIRNWQKQGTLDIAQDVVELRKRVAATQDPQEASMLAQRVARAEQYWNARRNAAMQNPLQEAAKVEGVGVPPLTVGDNIEAQILERAKLNDQAESFFGPVPTRLFINAAESQAFVEDFKNAPPDAQRSVIEAFAKIDNDRLRNGVMSDLGKASAPLAVAVGVAPYNQQTSNWIAAGLNKMQDPSVTFPVDFKETYNTKIGDLTKSMDGRNSAALYEAAKAYLVGANLDPTDGDNVEKAVRAVVGGDPANDETGFVDNLLLPPGVNSDEFQTFTESLTRQSLIALAATGGQPVVATSRGLEAFYPEQEMENVSFRGLGGHQYILVSQTGQPLFDSATKQPFMVKITPDVVKKAVR